MRNSSLYQEILESNDNIAYNNMAFYDEYIRLLNELILFSHSSLEIDINFQLDLNSNSIFSIGNLEYLNDGLKIKACLQNFIAKMTSDAYICGRYLQQAWSLFSTCMLLSSIESRCTQAALLTEVCLQLGCINFITNGNIMNCKRKFNGSLCSNKNKLNPFYCKYCIVNTFRTDNSISTTKLYPCTNLIRASLDSNYEINDFIMNFLKTFPMDGIEENIKDILNKIAYIRNDFAHANFIQNAEKNQNQRETIHANRDGELFKKLLLECIPHVFMILKLLSKPKEIISDSLSGMEIYANSRQIVLENLEYKVRKPSKQGKEYDRRVGRDHTLPDTMTQ